MTIDIEKSNELLRDYGISNCREFKNYVTFNAEWADGTQRSSKSLFTKLLSAAENAARLKFNLPDITIGVELEFVGSHARDNILEFSASMHRLTDGGFFYVGSYYHNDGTFWSLGKDGSIKYASTHENPLFGYELSSSKLPLCESSLSLLHDVTDLIKDKLHGEVNNSCGTHIHIGFPCNGMSYGKITRLLETYSEMEKSVFDPIVPTSRRRNKYCHSTSTTIRSKYNKLSARYCRFSFNGDCNVFHLECRQLEGTLDSNVIRHWITLQVAVLYDIISHIDDLDYLCSLKGCNAFDILLRYAFESTNNETQKFFLKRAFEFKSRTI